ncbi:DNA mismatch repair endonuclease MutL [uncultured Alistipes sp.]|uniref:DNA mismatch repair endonuclease MutL n=1 Tax=uncultured Alistipes sp. TaxID=538949 RepID=UPI00320A683E
MADKIRLLPEVVANQIAAGEVVNRPASVVKEMMENALDAGARSVKVNFRDGGKDLIQIVDDGCGMSPIDARMAFDRHATSKIGVVEDIYALHTFGFRGEALASIAAVAQVELRTRQEGDEVGTQTEINGGQFVGQTPVMCPVGSQFFVRNLFYNVPARRRFLDKSTTSASQIRTEFQRIALCYPQVAFELYANDAPVYNLQPASLAGRIVDVVGRHIKQNLLEVEADTSIARLDGFVGRPAAAKKRNTEQYLFVNGRFFKISYFTSAILKAYEKLIPESCQPSYFLYLTIDPARIDVNVHPQKTEVRFADEEAVWQIVNAAVRETLAKTGAVPMMDFDREGALEIPVLQKGAVYSEPAAMSNSDYNPFRDEYIDPSAPDPNVDFTGFDVPFSDADAAASAGGAAAAGRPSMRTGVSGTSGFRGAGARIPSFLRGGVLASSESDEFEDFESGSDFSGRSLPDDGLGTPSADGGFGESSLDFIPSSVTLEQQRLDIASQPEFTDPLPLPGGYLVALLNGRFVAVDVRRARERVLYEEYLRMLGHGSAVSQQLLFPERLLLSGDEYALLEEHAVEFAALGFDLDLCGAGAVEVKGTPADLPADSVDQLLFDLLQVFATPVSLADVRREKIAAVMAVSGAKCGMRNLSREEAAVLLDRLAQTGNVSFTPSGKTILAEITPEDLRAKLG